MNRALIVVDMLNDFVKGSGALFFENAISIVDNIQEELTKYELPIIYVCDSHIINDKEFELYPAHAITGTWGAQIIDELKPKPGDVVLPKTRFSGFYETELEDVLLGMNVDTVVICGVCTNICVMMTAIDAKQRDYNVVIHRDQVASFNITAHNFALSQLENVFGIVII